MQEVKAEAKYIRIPPTKVRLMASHIVGKKVDLAINTLAFSPNKSARLLLKVVNSAVANAEHNNNMDVSRLVVHRVYINQGPSMKRWHPRSQGRANPILKRTSHITVVVTEEN